MLTKRDKQKLKRWAKKIADIARKHTALGVKYGRRRYWVGIPAAFLSTASGAAIFATVKTCDDEDNSCTYVRYIGAALAVLSAGLSGVSTYLDYGGKSSKHLEAAKRYTALVRFINYNLGTENDNIEPELLFKNIYAQFEAIAATTPQLNVDIQLDAMDDEMLEVGELTTIAIDGDEYSTSASIAATESLKTQTFLECSRAESGDSSHKMDKSLQYQLARMSHV